jgi:5-methylcytosine-specific restriction endonuclease McrA
MDFLLSIVVLAPILVLIWFLVRHATRIRRDAIDKDDRMQRLEDLDPSLVQFVLARDQHTCQRCGTTAQVGVDFIGETPGESVEISAEDLESCCTECFFDRWKTLQDDVEETEEEQRQPQPERD